MATEHYDAIIVGAGISGISAAYHFQKHCPGKTYKILERRDNLGGTWDLFNYPGIRSDSDMYTFGFSFKPWSADQSIAEKQPILDYLQETVEEFGIEPHIRFGTYIKKVAWSSEKTKWAVSTDQGSDYSASYLFMCVGYYDYDQAYTPDFTGSELFAGETIHPQFWPTDLDYQDKEIVVIGSGATAITLVPALTDKAKHVTMLQRSPTYLGSKPAIDGFANGIAKWFGRHAARWWYILSSMFIYSYCRLFPERAKAAMIGDIQEILGDHFEAEHYTPDYKPWDQRVCLCPDADFFEAIKAEKASVVTDHIDQFTTSGVKLKSGKELPADIIVTATGLELILLGGIDIEIDGQKMDTADQLIYKGFMVSNAPNMFFCIGYTNASWTLKVDLSNKYACRLINYMDRKGFKSCGAEPSSNIQPIPLIDLDSGYVNRASGLLPKQGNKTPWRVYQNYLLDNVSFRFAPLNDQAIVFR